MMVSTDMIVQATIDYINDRDSPMFREVLGQRVDGIIAGAQKRERETILTLIQIQMNMATDPLVLAALQELTDMISSMPTFVS
jgi:hypothetical protein